MHTNKKIKKKTKLADGGKLNHEHYRVGCSRGERGPGMESLFLH